MKKFVKVSEHLYINADTIIMIDGDWILTVDGKQHKLAYKDMTKLLEALKLDD